MLDRIALYALWIAMVAFWVWTWNLTKTIQRHREQLLENEAWAVWVERKLKEANQSIEQRCHDCAKGPGCPGYDNGVIYPCPHFKELEI